MQATTRKKDTSLYVYMYKIYRCVQNPRAIYIVYIHVHMRYYLNA